MHDDVFGRVGLYFLHEDVFFSFLFADGLKSGVDIFTINIVSSSFEIRFENEPFNSFFFNKFDIVNVFSV